MKYHNSCFVVGHLGSDPVERAKSENFGPVVKFTVAENVTRFDKESGNYETLHTNWFQVTAFGSLAERVQTGLRKGARVAVQGRMKMSKFTDRAGEEKTGFEIIADEVAIWQGLPAHSADDLEANGICSELDESRMQTDEIQIKPNRSSHHRPVSGHGSAPGRARSGVGAESRRG